ncbi:quinone oxidoreductase family protein [Saccharopolyspora rosea]|uniref:Zinc-binding alcohol dehydrogenase family protein n=1 Tax=Saccharopolyspora rosea TaxID=524884 RepID=A0ABW3FU43_9PSEU|nr:NADP-dependent oxidoreductase [Saccharopolyspora rosea]
MKAVGVTEFGGPDALEVLDLPERDAGPGQVRIRVHAAAVNPTDTLIRSGGRQLTGGPPYVPGMDAAGVVDQVGPGVGDRLAVGQRVVALVVPSGAHGAYAERIVVPAASVVPAPAGADFPAAATLLMNAMTARLALDSLALFPGDVVAVTGAAGAFGGYVVQLAKADGLHVIADAKPDDEELVRGLGADEVVRRGDDVATRIRELVPDGVAGLADGALLHERVVPAVADGGAIATVRGWDGPAERGIRVRPVWVREAATDTAALDGLARQAESGVLSLRVARVVPAERAAEAHRLLEAGGVRGRLVLDFG